MPSSLKSAAISGVFWSFIDRFINQLVQFVVVIILARLLTPEDFGLVGMLTVFMLLANTLVDSGLSHALIQRQHRTETDFSTAFCSHCLLALTLYGVLYLSAPAIAHFYHEPELVGLSRLLFLGLLINALTMVHDARLIIALNFKAKAQLNFFAVLISGGVGIISAYQGEGYWSLVYQAITRSVCYLVFIYGCFWWKPTAKPSLASLNSLLGYGSRLMLAGLLSVFSGNLAALLIGRYFSAQTLGYYTQGKKYPELLSITITTILQRVTFPLLSQMQDDTDRLLSVYSRILRMTAFVTIPVMTGFAITAESFVVLLLTEKWLPVVGVIQGLCVAMMITPLNAVNLSLLTASGRSDLLLKLDLVKAPLSIAITAVTVPYGLTAIVAGQCFLKIISFLLNAYYPGKFYNYGLWHQLKAMVPVLTAVLIMHLAIGMLPTLTIAVDYLLTITVGVMTYLFAAYVLKIDEFFEILHIIKIRLINKV